jgi:hypothetical protein
MQVGGCELTAPINRKPKTEIGCETAVKVAVAMWLGCVFAHHKRLAECNGPMELLEVHKPYNSHRNASFFRYI